MVEHDPIDEFIQFCARYRPLRLHPVSAILQMPDIGHCADSRYRPLPTSGVDHYLYPVPTTTDSRQWRAPAVVQDDFYANIYA